MNEFHASNCGSEAALLVDVSAEVAEKRNTESGGRVTFIEGRFKRAKSLMCFLEGPLFFQAELHSSFSYSVVLTLYLANVNQNRVFLCVFFQIENPFLLFSSAACEMKPCSPSS